MSILPRIILDNIPHRYQQSAYRRADTARVALRISEAAHYTLTQSDLSIKEKIPRRLKAFIFETRMRSKLIFNSQFTRERLPR